MTRRMSDDEVLAVLDRELVRRANDRIAAARELAPELGPLCEDTARQCREARDAVAAMQQDAARWRRYASSPQTALMLGSTLDPNDASVDWAAESARLIDARAHA